MGRILICTMGLPRSGKSTWAREQGIPIVSPDAIRLELYGQPFWVPGEKMVWAIADLMVRSLFSAGHTRVILDATNFKLSLREKWYSPDWITVFKHIDTDYVECMRRAIAEGRDDLYKVIRYMYLNFEPLEVDEYVYFEGM
jgi:predicted kinase